MKFKKELLKKSGIYVYLDEINEYKEPALKKGDLMQTILKALKSRYWKDVIREYLPDDKPYVFNQYKLVRYSTRGDYINILNLNPKKSIVMDIGSGWGQALPALSRSAKEVWALEGTFERLEFIREKNKQDKLENIHLLNASILNLPFVENSFDVLTMSGVLEWVPVSDATKDPRDLQISALKECNRILKKGGQLCIGIENSHGLKYLFGELDDHTGVPHISYLPRAEATKKLQAIRGEDYRTYTYTKDGYLDLLAEAGFNRKNIKFYYPIPTYKIFSYIVPLDNLQNLNFIYKELRSNLQMSSIDKKVIEEELSMIKKGKIEELKNNVSSYFIKVTK